MRIKQNIENNLPLLFVFLMVCIALYGLFIFVPNYDEQIKLDMHCSYQLNNIGAYAKVDLKKNHFECCEEVIITKGNYYEMKEVCT